MAINQEAASRTLTLPVQQVSAGTGVTQLANATSAVGQLLTEKLNEVAIDKASTQGELDVLEGNAPEKLAFPITKATSAYNKAVSNTEARRMVISAEELINTSLAESKNPATFNSSTPAAFKSSLEGIKSGILQNTRPENRADVSANLDRMSAHAQLNMLEHSIQYDNQQAHTNLKQDVTGLLEARRNAAIAGDAERISGIDEALKSTLSDYATMNQQIKTAEPYLRQEIENHQQIDNVLMNYGAAAERKATPEFMRDLAQNKENLPFNVWQDAVKGVVALDQTHKRLLNDVNAEQWAGVQVGINNGSIQNASQLLEYPELTVPQQLTAMKQLDTVQAKQFAQGSKLITAQQNILSGRPEWNSGSYRDKMFQSAIQVQEQQTGQPATLADMSKSILGQSSFPASGMPQTPMGTNVPAFDSVMTGQLTNKYPVQTANAAQIFNYMVNTQDKPNSVNLTGDALAVATLFNTLNQGGTTPEQAAELAINTVLNATEPEIKTRSDRFHKEFEHTNPYTGTNGTQIKFKEVFNTNPEPFKSDNAYAVFQQTFRSNYLSSNSVEAATKATKFAMQKWGTSKYFDKGMVGQPVPEKELPITNIGNAFGNQIVSNLQGLINRNASAIAQHPDLKLPVIEWENPKQTVSGTESEQDKVFKKFTHGNRPRIKIDGHSTDVVLMPSASSRLGNRISYLYGVYDQFNNLHPLTDPTNQIDGTARFMPQELATWAPEVAVDKSNETFRTAALSVREQEKKQEIEELKNSIPLWKKITGLDKYDILQHVATQQNDGERLNEIVESLKGKSELASAEETRASIGNAENIGVSESLIPSIDFSKSETKEIKESKIPGVDLSKSETKEIKESSIEKIDFGKATIKEESMALKSSIESLYPKLTEKQVSEIVSNLAKAGTNIYKDVVNKLMDIAKNISKDEQKQTNGEPKSIEEVSSMAHKNPQLLKKTILSIQKMEGTSKSKGNQSLVADIRKLYPNLNEDEAKVVIDNLYLVLNKRKPSERAL